MAKRHVYEAVATLTGVTIGAGVLGIPFVFSKAGFLTGLLVLAVMALVVVLVNLCVGEIVLRTRGEHQLTGYAGIYLGKWGRRLMFLSIIVGSYGALMAYIIGEGQSLAELFGGNPWFWSMIFFVVASLIIYKGIKAVGSSELVLVSTKLLIFLTVVVLMVFSQAFDPNELTGFNLTNIFIPYGVILFAFLGAIAVPEMRREMKGHWKEMRKAIILGSIIPFAAYALFALAVVGVTGTDTTEVANVGVGRLLGFIPLVLINLFAILSLATSYIALGLGLKEVYQYDYNFKPLWAFVAAMFVPVVLIMAGIQSFILILGVTGAVSGGIEGILLLLTYWKAKKFSQRKPEYTVPIGPIAIALLSLVFLVGAIITIKDLALL